MIDIILMILFLTLIFSETYSEKDHRQQEKDHRQQEMDNFFRYQRYYNKKYPNHPESDYDRGGRFWMEYDINRKY